MALYTNQTAENILARMLARIDAKYDKRTGSIIFNTTAPTAEELAILYEALDYILDQALPDTAVREFLIRHCAARGIAPYAATGARVIGRFAPADTVLTEGLRFNCGAYYYSIFESIADPASVLDEPDTVNYSYYYLDCETVGEAPNGTTGRLIPAENIEGLKSGEIVEVSIFGEDEEETEALRQRYYDSFGAEAFGGNRSDYKQKILAMQGVGGVKVYSAWNGGGTVRCVITASGNVVPSLTLEETVQAAVDPDVIDEQETRGLGYGTAPIGHYVTVMGANGENIDLQTTITLESGFTLDDVLPEIKAVVEAYYSELNRNWMYVDNVVVRLAEINARILNIEHIIDIYDTTLNGGIANIVVDADSLAVAGTYNISVA